MRERVGQLVRQALERAVEAGDLPVLPDDYAVPIEKPRNPEHGDSASNVAMTLARVARKAPRQIADIIVRYLPEDCDWITAVEVAGPGFLNFRFADATMFDCLHAVRSGGEGYGRAARNDGPRVLVEFVSANPTGPLHVGHGRGAVMGDAVASLLDAAGYQVEREYYINDVGNQMQMLGRSLHARVQTFIGHPTALPEDGYQGGYLEKTAEEFVAKHGKLEVTFEDEGQLFIDFAKDSILEDIKADLEKLRITYDTWFPERSLHASEKVEGAVKHLQDADIIYERDGALVFRTTDFGDDDDRVVVRTDGRPTYFAADIAYHKDKMDRGFDTAIDVWGADHHGYIARVRASLVAFGYNPDQLEVLLVQFVSLVRDGEQVKMSTRSGKFEELKSVVGECGADAVRFLFLMRRADSQQEFDIEVAKSQTMENPVYYVQYGHARVCSILRRAKEAGIELPERPSDAAMSTLTLAEERQLILALTEYPYIVRRAAEAREPHQIAFYLIDTIKAFHSYYTRYKATERVISDDPLKTEGRLALVDGIRTVIANGLGLLKVHAPERMAQSDIGSD